jgi:hypothetical protein
MRHKVWIGARAYTRAELENAIFLATQVEQVQAEARELRDELINLHDALAAESVAHEETMARVSELERQLGEAWAALQAGEDAQTRMRAIIAGWEACNEAEAAYEQAAADGQDTKPFIDALYAAGARFQAARTALEDIGDAP